MLYSCWPLFQRVVDLEAPAEVVDTGHHPVLSFGKIPLAGR